MTNDTRRKPVRTAAGFLIGASLMLGGCAQVEDTARGAASKAASAAEGEVKDQICKLTEDGLVSVQDKELLAGLIPAARTAGLPEAILAPADQIAKAGDSVPEDALVKLRGECGQEPTPSSS